MDNVEFTSLCIDYKDQIEYKRNSIDWIIEGNLLLGFSSMRIIIVDIKYTHVINYNNK